MTLVLTVHSRDTLWLVADRRLSYGNRRPPVDDAIKLMSLGTKDGVGVLAYTGLGATQLGSHPSDWMSAVLRGRAGLTFEQALGLLTAAANRELPKHLIRTPGNGHSIIVPAFITGVGARLYSIDNYLDPRTRQHSHRYTSHQLAQDPNSPSVRLALAGTGGFYLETQGATWKRPLLSLVKAHDRAKISDGVVADALAKLNYTAHCNMSDGTVGPRCIVVWRRRKDARPGPAGGHYCYAGVERETAEMIPEIDNGFDVRSVDEVFLEQFRSHLSEQGFLSPPDFDVEKMNRRLAKLPFEPDERLR